MKFNFRLIGIIYLIFLFNYLIDYILIYCWFREKKYLIIIFKCELDCIVPWSCQLISSLQLFCLFTLYIEFRIRKLESGLKDKDIFLLCYLGSYFGHYRVNWEVFWRREIHSICKSSNSSIIRLLGSVCFSFRNEWECSWSMLNV